ncbi:sarcosine oxidase [Cobetia sp. L2A1]|uniref:sarcosine oxidase n=1 Tax=Cobetia sp. L2A1 TaxID=2686360 RepID=UPI0018EEED59|nr:sarcosine oxidase [Cobetia sp. L2A1]
MTTTINMPMADVTKALARCPLPASLTQPEPSRLTTEQPSNDIGRCILADLSALARAGIRGRDATDFLAALNWQAPMLPNTAVAQQDGSWLVRLSVGEFLQLSPTMSDDQGAGDLPLIEQADIALADGQRVHSLPRRDSHAWFSVKGTTVPALMAKLCGVDLRSEAFPPGSVAQTSVARTNTIVVNVGSLECPCFHLLFDIASSHYMWGVLIDAMQEYQGQKVTATTLLLPH